MLIFGALDGHFFGAIIHRLTVANWRSPTFVKGRVRGMGLRLHVVSAQSVFCCYSLSASRS